MAKELPAPRAVRRGVPEEREPVAAFVHQQRQVHQIAQEAVELHGLQHARVALRAQRLLDHGQRRRGRGRGDVLQAQPHPVDDKLRIAPGPPLRRVQRVPHGGRLLGRERRQEVARRPRRGAGRRGGRAVVGRERKQRVQPLEQGAVGGHADEGLPVELLPAGQQLPQERGGGVALVGKLLVSQAAHCRILGQFGRRDKVPVALLAEEDGLGTAGGACGGEELVDPFFLLCRGRRCRDALLGGVHLWPQIGRLKRRLALP